MPLLTTKQLREWRMYYEIEPFGSIEQDLQHGYTRKILVETLGGKPKSGKGYSIFDLSLLKLRREDRETRRNQKSGNLNAQKEQKEQTVEDMKSVLKRIANISNTANTVNTSNTLRKNKRKK